MPKKVTKEQEKAPEKVIEEQSTPSTEKVTKEQEKAPKAGKVYRFTSDNPFLTVTSLGVQFRAGKAETTDLAVARALATLSGVSLVD